MRQSIAGIIARDGMLLIGRRLPTGEMADRWEFPGGKIDPGESPQETIPREFLEEFGVAVAVGEFIGSARFTNRNGPSDLLAFSVLFPENADIALTEHTELRWATLEEIRTLPFVDSDLLLLPAIEKWMGTKS
jgi:8-oxo-dGTP diphosphatase